jgi:predicted Zn-dependent protease with MMP-like domain
MGGLGDRLRRLFGGRGERTAERAPEAVLQALDDEVRALVEAERAAKAARRLTKARAAYPSDPAVAALAGDVFFDLGAFAEAAGAFEAALRLDPEDAYSAAFLAGCRLELGDVDGAREAVAEARRRDRESPDAAWWEAVLHDLDGKDEAGWRDYRRAVDGAPDDYVLPQRVPRKRFQRLAEKAYHELERDYPGFQEALQSRNVTLRIQDVPTPEQIADGYNPLWLGVFQGHMGPEVSLEDPWSALPSHVILFQRNIERECADPAELYEQVKITLLHEVAHAHGREEDWMEERGLQ